LPRTANWHCPGAAQAALPTADPLSHYRYSKERMKTSLFSRDALAEPTPVRAPAQARGASRLAAIARAAAPPR
jgi:hypothetical protein